MDNGNREGAVNDCSGDGAARGVVVSSAMVYGEARLVEVKSPNDKLSDQQKGENGQNADGLLDPSQSGASQSYQSDVERDGNDVIKIIFKASLDPNSAANLEVTLFQPP